MLSYSLKTFEKHYRSFRSKEDLKKDSFIPKFVIDTIISNWTSCRTI